MQQPQTAGKGRRPFSAGSRSSAARGIRAPMARKCRACSL